MINKLILGTVQLGVEYGVTNETGLPSLDSALEILELASKENVSTLDTAASYGRSESVISKFHQIQKYRFQVNTKLSPGLPIPGYRSFLEERIKSMDVDSIHTLFFHGVPDERSLNAGLEELQKLKREGLIKEIGVSIYTDEEAVQMSSIKGVDTIQIPFNLLDNFKRRGRGINELKNAGKIIQARSVYLQGILASEKVKNSKVRAELEKPVSDAGQLAMNSGMTLKEFALNYPFSHHQLDFIVLGMETREQLFDNLKFIKNITPLSEKVKKEIEQINAPTAALDPRNWK